MVSGGTVPSGQNRITTSSNIPTALQLAFTESRGSNEKNVDLYATTNAQINSPDWKNSFEDIRDAVYSQTPPTYYTKTDIGAEFRRKKFNGAVTNYNNGRVSEITFTEQQP